MEFLASANSKVGVLTASLWAGLIVLTAMLLILIRSRWGQTRPIAKCVALSVFAHILLLGYAYATKLLLDVPPPAPERVLRVSMMNPEHVDEEGPDSAPAADKPSPWEQPDDQVTAIPDVDPLPRELVEAATDPPFDFEPETTDLLPDDTAEPPVETLPGELSEPPPLPDPSLVQNSAPAVAEPPIEQPLPPVEPPAELPLEPISEPPVDTVAELPRQEPLPDPAVSPSPETMEPLPTVPIEMDNAPEPAAPLASRHLTDHPNTDEAAHNQVAVEPTPTLPSIAEQPSQFPIAPADTTAQIPPVAAIPPRPVAQPTSLPITPHSAGEQLRTIVQDHQQNARARAGDGQALPWVYHLRFHPQRNQIAQPLGATVESQNAVDSAMIWLANAQAADGHWDASQYGAGKEQRVLGHDRHGAGANADTGISGLALLALMGNGNTHLEGPYRQNVQFGLEYLISQQTTDGSLAGQAQLFARTYCHAMATLALSEAYALTGDERLLPYVKLAIQFSVNSQHIPSGGWRYRPGDEGDMSQFGWQILAFRSAELGGLRTPAQTRAGMLRFLHQTSGGPNGGLGRYKRGGPVSATMTAEALLCRYLLKSVANQAALNEAADYVGQNPPRRGEPNFYYWYYATLAMYQHQGPAWVRWNQFLQKELLPLQTKTGAHAGSWSPDTTWGCYGGRVYSTALAALCLEVYYRYLPINQSP